MKIPGLQQKKEKGCEYSGLCRDIEYSWQPDNPPVAYWPRDPVFVKEVCGTEQCQNCRLSYWYGNNPEYVEQARETYRNARKRGVVEAGIGLTMAASGAAIAISNPKIYAGSLIAGLGISLLANGIGRAVTTRSGYKRRQHGNSGVNLIYDRLIEELSSSNEITGETPEIMLAENEIFGEKDVLPSEFIHPSVLGSYEISGLATYADESCQLNVCKLMYSFSPFRSPPTIRLSVRQPLRDVGVFVYKKGKENERSAAGIVFPVEEKGRISRGAGMVMKSHIVKSHKKILESGDVMPFVKLILKTIPEERLCKQGKIDSYDDVFGRDASLDSFRQHFSEEEIDDLERVYRLMQAAVYGRRR